MKIITVLENELKNFKKDTKKSLDKRQAPFFLKNDIKNYKKFVLNGDLISKGAFEISMWEAGNISAIKRMINIIKKLNK